MAQVQITLGNDVIQGLFMKDGLDKAFSRRLDTILNQVLEVQSEEQLGAARYERTSERVAYRNGSRDRLMTTRIGTIMLHIPRHRDGLFSTELYERYQRSEQAV